MHVRNWGAKLAGTLVLALAGVLGLAVAPPAVASPAHPASVVAARPTAVKAAPGGVHPVCPAPDRAGVMACLSLIRGNGHGSVHPDLINPSAYAPAQLQEAYDLVAASATGGAGMTVAVVDGGNDPDAASDLAVYQKEWGLPACDKATGAGCVVTVNQNGKTSPLPIADPTGGWEVEESLDIDMVSAICPSCRIMLVAANLVNEGFLGYDPTINDFVAAEDAAVAAGAKFISNSWGGIEYPGVQAFDSYFRHPGVAITVAAGDDGYGPSYPATTQFVTSVGGTSLAPAPGTARGWTETVWDGTGSGCSAIEAKPAWQTADDTKPDGCLNRTDNDVSAVADPNTGVWTYDTYPYNGEAPQWQTIGGTSVASPIIAAIYALAGPPESGTYPASYLYQKSHAADFYPVTSGSNGVCETYRAYLCHGEPGYNGPAGLGTPHGTAAFSSATPGNTVSVTDPGTQDVSAGAKLRLALQAVDSAGAKLTYTARNLPHGLSISSSGVISGTLPKTPATSAVTVTAADASGATGSVSFRIVAVPDLAAGYRRVTGQVKAVDAVSDLCLDDTGNAAANGSKTEFAKCGTSAAQQWAFVPGPAPDGLQTLQIHGKCLETAGTGDGSRLQLAPCDGAGAQAWSLEQGFGSLWNPASGRCLTDPNEAATAAVPAEIYDCNSSLPSTAQQFTFPAGPILSAEGKLCAEDPGNKTAPVELEPCDGSSTQDWEDFSAYEDTASGVPTTHHGRCLSAPVAVDQDTESLDLVEGIPVVAYACIPTPPPPTTDYLNGDWETTTNGEIFNSDAGLCLADPGSSAKAGTRLVLEDCDGDAGEIWAVG